MRKFDDYKNYLDYSVLEYFYCINDIEIVKQNAYVCFLHFLNSCKSISDEKFLEFLNNKFYEYLFRYTIKNIELFNDYNDKVMLSLKVFLDFYKTNKKYPTIKDLYKIYGVSKMNAYKIYTYASEKLDIKVPEKCIYNDFDYSVDDYLNEELTKYLINSIIMDLGDDDIALKIMLMKNGYNNKKKNYKVISSILGLDENVVKNKYKEVEDKIIKKYKKEYFY